MEPVPDTDETGFIVQCGQGFGLIHPLTRKLVAMWPKHFWAIIPFSVYDVSTVKSRFHLCCTLFRNWIDTRYHGLGGGDLYFIK